MRAASLERLVPVADLVALEPNNLRLDLLAQHKQAEGFLGVNLRAQLLLSVLLKRRVPDLVGVVSSAKSQLRLDYLELPLQVHPKQQVVSLVLLGNLVSVEHKTQAPDLVRVEACLVVMHNSRNRPPGSLLEVEIQVLALGEVGLEQDLEQLLLPTILVVACSALIQRPPRSEVGSSSLRQQRIPSALLVPTSRIKPRRRRALVLLVLVDNSKSREVCSARLIRRRTIRAAAYLAPTPKLMANNSRPMEASLGLVTSPQQPHSSVHLSLPLRALDYLAVARVIQITQLLVSLEASGVPIITITTIRLSKTLEGDSSELPISHSKSLVEDCSAIPTQRPGVAYSVMAPTTMLSSQLPILSLGAWGQTISNRNPTVFLAIRTMHPVFSATPNSSRTHCNLLRL